MTATAIPATRKSAPSFPANGASMKMVCTTRPNNHASKGQVDITIHTAYLEQWMIGGLQKIVEKDIASKA
jgi:hypothetical protein